MAEDASTCATSCDIRSLNSFSRARCFNYGLPSYRSSFERYVLIEHVALRSREGLDPRLGKCLNHEVSGIHTAGLLCAKRLRRNVWGGPEGVNREPFYSGAIELLG